MSQPTRHLLKLKIPSKPPAPELGYLKLVHTPHAVPNGPAAVLLTFSGDAWNARDPVVCSVVAHVITQLRNQRILPPSLSWEHGRHRHGFEPRALWILIKPPDFAYLLNRDDLSGRVDLALFPSARRDVADGTLEAVRSVMTQDWLSHATLSLWGPAMDTPSVDDRQGRLDLD